MVLILFAASFVSVVAQGRGPMSQKAHEKISELEKLKLMETLNLDESKMVKFFARRKEFQDKIQDLNKQRNDVLDQVQNALNNEGNSSKDEQYYKKYVESIKTIDLNLVRARNEYFNSLRDILTQKQLAKLMVFERNFKKELRDIIFKERRKNMQD
jgi:hypothetical protein